MQQSAVMVTKPRTAAHPGTEGLWIFVFIDMMIFLLIFLVFMLERMGHLALYSASQQHLEPVFAIANTLILLTSSWMVVEAVHAAHARRDIQVARYLAFALILGLAFSVSKVLEYRADFASGIYPVSNAFYSFYFFITGVHFLHVLSGMIFIFFFMRQARSGGVSARYIAGLENVGLFWHYVDVLWIFIFPLLYLVGQT